MSRHQAYRNYDYENDLDEYEGADYSDGEEELSPEDRAQMTAASAQVRAALGTESAKVTSRQLEDALWHYYYDVDKSVSYLTTKFLAPKPAKNAPPRKKDTGGRSTFPLSPPRPAIIGPAVADGTAWHGLALSGTAEDRALPMPNRPAPGFFQDMPWLKIPKQRETVFIAPVRPPGGLLGGTGAPGKMSKLQALAAARKKKADQQATGESGMQKTTQKMSTLSVGPSAQENIRPPATAGRETHSRQPDGATETRSPRRDVEHARGIRKDTPADAFSQWDAAPPPTSANLDVHGNRGPAEPAAPSAFAQTILGSAPGSASPAPAHRKEYPLPYLSLVPSVTDAFSGPSPDDVVSSAQSKASNKKIAATSSKQKGGPSSRSDEVADGVKGIRIDDTPLPKSKNLDVLSEFEKSKSKKSTSFVVVGHVDAGKSTLMGRLLLDLEVVDQRTIQKYRKEAETMGKSSFALAWVLDQRSEERSRGVTIDIATNKFETETTSFTVLDAPGHRDFIPNMIAGASQADFAILVVDAATGAFEAGLKGQTREHSLLLRSMGVSRIIVAVNKLDTVGWSQERFEEISQQVSGFLAATGFQLKNVSFVPVSGLQGDNLVKRSTDPAASWYKGDTLIAELEKSEPTGRALDKALRLTISEVFRSPQSPLTISGRVEAGSLQAGDALLVQPSGEKAYVKSLELDMEPVEWAVAGQNVVIHLSNIDPIHVRVGDIVCDPKQPVPCVDTFTVKVLAFDILMPMQVDVHRGRLHAPGRIAEIPSLLDKVKGTPLKKKPRIVKPASVARVVVKMTAKVPLEAGQRVVLRSGGDTVAAGLLE